MYAITAESVDDAHDWVLEIRARVRYHAKDKPPSRAAAMVLPPAAPTAAPTAAAAATAVAVKKPEAEGGASRSVTTEGPGPRSVLNRHGDARPRLQVRFAAMLPTRYSSSLDSQRSSEGSEGSEADAAVDGAVSGWLDKRGNHEGTGKLQRRYFVLRKGVLRYFKVSTRILG